MNKSTYIVLAIIFVLTGFAFFFRQFKMSGVNKVVKGNEAVILDIWLDEIPSTRNDLFEKGKFANLIIRNRPHGKLEIVDYNCVSLSTDRFYLRRVSVPTVEAPTQEEAFKEPFLWQCRLTLKDNEALSTVNGYMSHGNQLKIGTRIALEDALYRVDGFIVNVKPE